MIQTTRNDQLTIPEQIFNLLGFRWLILATLIDEHYYIYSSILIHGAKPRDGRHQEQERPIIDRIYIQFNSIRWMKFRPAIES